MKSMYKKILVLLTIPLILLMCMTIENIFHPENPQVNSEIEIVVDLKLVAENDNNTKMIFAVLAPKAWNIAENSNLTFTTTGYTKGDVVNEPLTVVPASDNEPTTALPWSSALQKEIGLMDNLGPVEWVVFESQTTFIITDEDEKLITAKVNIKLQTGPDNIKLFMGYFFTGKDKGLHSEYYKGNAKSKVITVLGGSNPLIDFTTAPLTSTVPATFGFGDLFAVNFETKTQVLETELHGANKVYMLGKVIYEDGTESELIDITNDKTLMTKIGNTTWQKYIYVDDYFNLPADAEIESVHIYFANEDKSIIVKDTSGEDFIVKQNCN
ncbi:MAG: DUF4961 domain-containing protein [Fermentimonas sp.]|nr:DUF4961 domain-containing protein [Fermentimonas sp.]